MMPWIQTKEVQELEDLEASVLNQEKKHTLLEATITINKTLPLET